MTLKTGPADVFRHLAVASLVLLVATAMLAAIDTRTLGNGDAVWLKPGKFALSFVVLFATLAAASRPLNEAWRSARLTRLAAWASVSAFAFEMGYIGTQAARAQNSHFNDSAPLYEILYALMGVGAVLLMLAVLAIGYGVARDRQYALPATVRCSIVVGFALSAALTIWTAGELGGNGGHFVGRPISGAAVPLLGWSLEVGDLRPAHFLALHAMQIVPVVGALVHAVVKRPRSRLPIVLVFAACYTAATIGVFVRAKAGLPLWSAV